MTINEQKASNDWSVADIIHLLARHLPDDLKIQALSCARKLNDPSARVSALSSLSVVTSEADAIILQEEALAVAQGIENQWLKVRALADVANALPNDRKEQVLTDALACIELIPGEWQRRRALMLLADILPDNLADQAVLLAHGFKNEQARVQTLAKFACRLSDREKIALLKDAPLIDDERTRWTTLMSLMKYLPLESKSELLKYASALREAGPCSQAFATLAEYFPDRQAEFQHKALEKARSIPIPHERVWVLLDFIQSLPETQRGEIIEETLGVTQLVEDEQMRAYDLFDLATFLPEDKRPAIIQEALKTARCIEDIFRRTETLLVMIGALPEDLHPDIVRESMMAINC